jgi:stage III sporulation protein AA
MLKSLLNPGISEAISRMGKSSVSLFEIRMRTGKPLCVRDKTGNHASMYDVTADDIEFALARASEHSVYAISEQLVKGYIVTGGGIRIGVAGEGVTEGGRLLTLKNICGLNIRIPHEVRGCADELRHIVKGGLANILIVSPPGAGKTTMLRELTRLYSSKQHNILLIDERCEIAAVHEGVPSLDVGEFTDVVSGIEKNIVYENVVRSMRPDMIVTDEVFGTRDTESVADIIRAGVYVMASIHATDITTIKNTVYDRLLQLFDYHVILSSPGGKLNIIEKRSLHK